MSSTARIVIAGTHSGVGKTTISLGLMRALARRGRQVAPFKVGPDFLDPGHHAVAAGRPGHNLDGWMLSRETNLDLFESGSSDADAAVIEGVMGLFDGYDGRTESGSTAQMAKWIDAPVLLVLDCYAMARSAGAMALGYERFDPQLRFAGVVLNRVASDSHEVWLREAIETGTGLPVLGALRNDPEIKIAERHLGLVQAREADREKELDRIARSLEDALDLDALLRIASPGAPSAQASRDTEQDETLARPVRSPGYPPGHPPVTIGVARDDAFSFYYEANLSALRQSGARLIEFSPLRDELPADLDGLYLGGGYPELFAEALASNRSLLTSVRSFAESRRPILAECGGMMWLGETLRVDGVAHELAGVLPIETAMTPRPTLGYREVRCVAEEGPLPTGLVARGHCYHHSEIVRGPEQNALQMTDGPTVGFSRGRVLASYVHLHFRSSPDLAHGFVHACRR